MALKLATDLATGISIPEGYFKIRSILATPVSFEIIVSFYYNEQSRLDDKPEIGEDRYFCATSSELGAPDHVGNLVEGTISASKDIIARGYEYLKANISKFSTAIDV